MYATLDCYTKADYYVCMGMYNDHRHLDGVTATLTVNLHHCVPAQNLSST